MISSTPPTNLPQHDEASFVLKKFIPPGPGPGHCFSLFPLQRCTPLNSHSHYHSTYFGYIVLLLVYIYSYRHKLVFFSFSKFSSSKPQLLVRGKVMMRFVSGNVAALKLIDSCLRLLVIPLSLASICLSVNNHQENTIYGKLEFSTFKGFKYLICVSAFSGGYALVAAVFAWIRVLANKPWLFFISDQVIAYLLITSVSAVAETTYLLYNGARDVSWSEACISYGKFCNKLVLILGVNALAFLVFLILALISAYRVFSLYELPYLHSKEVEEERT